MSQSPLPLGLAEQGKGIGMKDFTMEIRAHLIDQARQ
jgi:hypothetical protein